ncbi:colicin V production protein [Diaminobutyricimonas aerilata]|uniref:Colicin V production protein n=1 Tax=Diaminobutyricimonas aerilata TaxID=1162967 RepID=A0A2M9CKZ8_9MICO|nr:MarP family serine protease [Diaminobutyricimonas aerilata]PJJ72564.1 colicin V production protein [Diaminobutyricimonas aerilata]
MPGSLVLDVLLVLLLIGGFVYGIRRGLLHSVAAVAGLVAGGIGAFFAVPLVTGWVGSPAWRGPAVLAVVLLLVVGGYGVGATIGGALSRGVGRRGPLRVLDRLLGGVANLAVSAAVLSMVAFSVVALGVPILSPGIASSTVVRSIDSVTPDPVRAFLAQLRAAVVDEGLPRITEALTGAPPEIPDLDTASPALREAALSVARITGNAFACGQGQSGSGAVIAEDRVITNAHVVAGVEEPFVELPGRGAVPGRVVYFDPSDDLAVIHAPGLDGTPLPTGAALATGDAAVVDGYPFGGPFRSGPAEVMARGPIIAGDVYGTGSAPRDVYTLAADIEQGNSGGPLLDTAGALVGIVFAKSAEVEDVGYALTLDEVGPVIDRSASLEQSVDSGACVHG